MMVVALTFVLRYCTQAKACGYPFVLLHYYYGITLLEAINSVCP